ARVQRPIQAAFDPATAERLIAEPGVHRLGRHLRTAALAGLSPTDVLAWHAQQLEARDIEVTAANLIRDVVPKITDAAARANSRWADEHAATLTEHFPMAVALAEHSDDPRWNTAIGRMRELTDHGGYDLDRLCTQITDATHSTRHGAGVLAALDDIAPPQRSAVDPAAPAWLPTPDLDAHVVDHAAADRLHADYAAITAEHVELTSRIAAADEPDRLPEFGFTAHLPARPVDDEQLTAEWNRTAADIAAYRDRGSVTDTTSVAGDRPDDRAEHATFNAVHRDIDTLAEHIDEHHRAQQEERIRQLREEHDIEHHRTLTEHNPVVEHDRQRRGPRM
ncbi:MAG: hypothetical protein WA965_18085, partial [Mycobacterium sp.]